MPVLFTDQLKCALYDMNCVTVTMDSYRFCLTVLKRLQVIEHDYPPSFGMNRAFWHEPYTRQIFTFCQLSVQFDAE